MNRTRLLIATAAVAVLGLSACGGDSVADKVQQAAQDTSVAGDVTLPGGTLPAAVGDLLPEDCKALYGQFIGAMAASLNPQAEIDVEKVFGEAKAKLPADLQDDIEFLATTFAEFTKKMQENQNNPAGIGEVMAMMQDPKVQEASDHVNAWFEETCPQ